MNLYIYIFSKLTQMAQLQVVCMPSRMHKGSFENELSTESFTSASRRTTWRGNREREREKTDGHTYMPLRRQVKPAQQAEPTKQQPLEMSMH